MKTAIYPGSFDPVTLGHIDVIKRASKLFDYLIIGVLNNRAKTPLFSVEERVKMLEEVTKECNANAVVRGLRAITDFEYELQIAQLNRVMDTSIDTVFLTTSLEYAYLSSSIVKEVAAYGGDISNFVTPYVADEVHKRLRERQGSQM